MMLSIIRSRYSLPENCAERVLRSSSWCFWDVSHCRVPWDATEDMPHCSEHARRRCSLALAQDPLRRLEPTSCHLSDLSNLTAKSLGDLRDPDCISQPYYIGVMTLTSLV